MGLSSMEMSLNWGRYLRCDLITGDTVIMAMDVRCKTMALSTITSMSWDSDCDGMVVGMKCSFAIKKCFKLHCLGGSCDHHLLSQESVYYSVKG